MLDEITEAAWKPIGTAPEGSRVLVAGYQKASGNVAGYWWWHEGCVFDGADPEHPNATHWHPILKAKFPAPPANRNIAEHLAEKE